MKENENIIEQLNNFFRDAEGKLISVTHEYKDKWSWDAENLVHREVITNVKSFDGVIYIELEDPSNSFRFTGKFITDIIEMSKTKLIFKYTTGMLVEIELVT